MVNRRPLVVINGQTQELPTTDSVEGALDEATAIEIAEGSTLGLSQFLLAEDGQVARTVLACGPTTDTKVQGVSLGNSNVIEVYASGEDFNNRTVLYREFMSKGEPIVFTGLSFGSIITATQGFYGMTGLNNPSNTSQVAIMPLMSYGLSFRETFFFAFRTSEGSLNSRGIIFIVNGPLVNTIKITDGSGAVVRQQENITLQPWESSFLDTDGNKEYILSGTQQLMACVLSAGPGTALDGPVRDPASIDPTALASVAIRDCRLILPLSSDIIGHPRFGFVSALYNDTVVNWYDRQSNQGVLGTAGVVSPNSPQDADAATSAGGTGNSQGQHNPAGYTRFIAEGLISGFSGADGLGLEAVPFAPVNTFSNVVAQPFRLGGTSSSEVVTIFSPYEGTANVFEWDDTSQTAVLKYTLNITRDRNVGDQNPFDPNDQLFPAAASLSQATSNTNNTTPVGASNPGYIEADIPIAVVSQARSTQPSFRSQNGTTATGLPTDADETLMFGWSPEDTKTIIRRDDTTGMLFRLSITGGTVGSGHPIQSTIVAISL